MPCLTLAVFSKLILPEFLGQLVHALGYTFYTALDHGIHRGPGAFAAIAKIGAYAENRLIHSMRKTYFPRGTVIDLRAVKKGHNSIAVQQKGFVGLQNLLRSRIAPRCHIVRGDEIAGPERRKPLTLKICLKMLVPQPFRLGEQRSCLIDLHLFSIVPAEGVHEILLSESTSYPWDLYTLYFV